MYIQYNIFSCRKFSLRTNMRFKLECFVWLANRVSHESKLDLRDLNLSQSWSAHHPDSLQIQPQLENQLEPHFSCCVVISVFTQVSTGPSKAGRDVVDQRTGQGSSELTVIQFFDLNASYGFVHGVLTWPNSWIITTTKFYNRRRSAFIDFILVFLYRFKFWGHTKTDWKYFKI